MERIKTAFRYADKDGKGALSKHQYKIAMTVLFGFPPEKFETKQVFEPPKKFLSYEEFFNWVQKKGYPSNAVIDAKILFALLDKDFKDHVNVSDFYSATENTDLKVSKAIWRKCFREMDKQKKGFLNIDELSEIMNM